MKATFVIVFSILLIFAGCKKDDSSPTETISTQKVVTDADLYMLGKSSAGFVYYKHSDALLSRASGSGHTDQPFLRTRYNAIAATQLDANGKVKSGAVFPDSSLIVKELYKADSTLDVYAFMFKLKGATNADNNGWVWGEAKANGDLNYPVSNKGSGCNGCHSVGVDYTRMNDSQ